MVFKPDWEPQFVEYFTLRAPVLRRLGYTLCGDWHTAEDLVQATFVKLYRHWPRVRGDSIDAYTRRILVNAFLSQRRATRRESVTADPPESAVGGVDPAERLAVHRALAALAARRRGAALPGGSTDRRGGGPARCDRGTVKSQTARAIQAMRVTLDNAWLSGE